MRLIATVFVLLSTLPIHAQVGSFNADIAGRLGPRTPPRATAHKHFTQEQYDRLKVGMALKEVVAIMGSSGEYVPTKQRTNGTTGRMFYWISDDYDNVVVSFDKAGNLAEKASSWDRNKPDAKVAKAASTPSSEPAKAAAYSPADIVKLPRINGQRVVITGTAELKVLSGRLFYRFMATNGKTVLVSSDIAPVPIPLLDKVGDKPVSLPVIIRGWARRVDGVVLIQQPELLDRLPPAEVAKVPAGNAGDQGGTEQPPATQPVPGYIPSGSGSKPVQIKGYTTKNGTYVKPHTRSLPRR